MAALTASAGIVTISNTTDTYSPYSSGTPRFLPVGVIATFSVAGRIILQDANGVTLLDITGAANSTQWLDEHFFQRGIAMWTAPVKCAGTFPGGGKLRLYGL